MTTDAEQRVRDLLESAASEPPRPLDGAGIRRRAEDGSGQVVPMRAPRSATLSVVLAAAAVIVVALAVVGLVIRAGSDDPAPPAGGTHPGSRTPVATGPAVCENADLVLQGGRFDTHAKRTTLTIRDDGRHRCTLAALPSIRLSFDGAVSSTLPASRYRPALPVVIGPQAPVVIVVRFRARATDCGGTGPGRTQLGYVLDGNVYSFDVPIDGCRNAIASAAVRS